MSDIQEVIRTQVTENPVVLYMKGSPDFPQCGFSGRVVQILKSFQKPFMAIDVLSSPEIRSGIKTFSNWPTIPQLYVNGEFVGGCDIMIEMYNSGELAKLLETVEK